MAKVSKIDLILNKSYPEPYEVHYNAKNMPLFSVKGLPEDFHRTTNVRVCGYDTEAALESSIMGGVYLYRKLKTTKRKVIVYSASASADVRMNKVSHGCYQGIAKGVSQKIVGIDHADGAAVGLKYEVMFEVDDMSNKKYFLVGENEAFGNSKHISMNAVVIDWTQEREEFFESIYDAMRALAVKMSDFIEKDEDAISLLVASRQKLLG